MKRTLLFPNIEKITNNIVHHGHMYYLKGLSQEKDLEKFEKKFTELGLTKGRCWFLNFLGALMFSYHKKFNYCG